MAFQHLPCSTNSWHCEILSPTLQRPEACSWLLLWLAIWALHLRKHHQESNKTAANEASGRLHPGHSPSTLQPEHTPFNNTLGLKCVSSGLPLRWGQRSPLHWFDSGPSRIPLTRIRAGQFRSRKSDQNFNSIGITPESSMSKDTLWKFKLNAHCCEQPNPIQPPWHTHENTMPQRPPRGRKNLPEPYMADQNQVPNHLQTARDSFAQADARVDKMKITSLFYNMHLHFSNTCVVSYVTASHRWCVSKYSRPTNTHALTHDKPIYASNC